MTQLVRYFSPQNVYHYTTFNGMIDDINAALGGLIPIGTRLPFAQASAPMGWTQDVTEAANNRMLRVVVGAGGGMGGSHSPIYNNVVPGHSHGFTTGKESADHSHPIGDPGHQHQSVQGSPDVEWGYGQVTNQNSFHVIGNYTGMANTGIWTGGITADHTHNGSTDNGSSPTDWAPRYIDMIICVKN